MNGEKFKNRKLVNQVYEVNQVGSSCFSKTPIDDAAFFF